MRARKPEEKALRCHAILTAARQMARESGAISLGLNELARRSLVSKANIYRYFESREEVLLRLLLGEMEEVTLQLEEQLMSQRDVIGPLARTLVSRPLFCELLGMLSAILEHNLSASTIAEAKRAMHAFSGRIAGAIARANPQVSLADASFALNSIAFYMAGLWPATHPSATAMAALARPELAGLELKMEDCLTRFLQTLFAGLTKSGNKAQAHRGGGKGGTRVTKERSPRGK